MWLNKFIILCNARYSLGTYALSVIAVVVKQSFIWACLYKTHKRLMWDIKLTSTSIYSAFVLFNHKLSFIVKQSVKFSYGVPCLFLLFHFLLYQLVKVLAIKYHSCGQLKHNYVNSYSRFMAYSVYLMLFF